ncbi:MAG: SMC-Scp complex subunit ScpB [Verrucomicrobiae bacterium]|nr:SMC-Scp complex subunit ScpB [Verrucomicrobiae bacterium]
MLPSILEALLFTSQKALSLKELFALIKSAATSLPAEAPGLLIHITEKEISEALQMLHEELLSSHRSYELHETASGWQLKTKSSFAPWIRHLFPEARSTRLSAPALETLAIIAYRQPITRADVEAVRGVAVDGVVQTLLDRGLIRIAGRAEIPGRPLLYATSQSFLNHFGLRSLEELPNAAELGRLELPKATIAILPDEKTVTSTEEKITLPAELAPPVDKKEEKKV